MTKTSQMRMITGSRDRETVKCGLNALSATG